MPGQTDDHEGDFTTQPRNSGEQRMLPVLRLWWYQAGAVSSGHEASHWVTAPYLAGSQGATGQFVPICHSMAHTDLSVTPVCSPSQAVGPPVVRYSRTLPPSQTCVTVGRQAGLPSLAMLCPEALGSDQPAAYFPGKLSGRQLHVGCLGLSLGCVRSRASGRC